MDNWENYIVLYDAVIQEKPSILIIGNARHGKDTAAEYFRDNYRVTFNSSSQAACDIFLFDALKDEHKYSTIDKCFEDRVNHRKLWHDLICEYNIDDKARLAKGIMEKNDCYVGMRSNEEAQTCIDQGIFDLVIWVDASDRLPLEKKDSFDIDKSIADFIIDNNGTLQQFEHKLRRIAEQIF